MRLPALLFLALVSAASAGHLVSSRVSNAPQDLWEYDLYRVDGGVRTRLTSTPGPEGEPAVDGAGTKLAFTAVVTGADARPHFALFTMPLAGGAATRHAASLVEAGHPSFDPTGERIVFPGIAPGRARFTLWLLELSSGAVRELPCPPGNSWSPEWSPDGRAIAFACDGGVDKAGDLYVLHVATGTVERLTDDPLMERDPRWSPDGCRIAYVRRLTPFASELWLIDRDGRDRAPVLTGPGINIQPAFTPDGRALLFTSSRGGHFNVWRLDLETSAVMPVDPGPQSDQSPRPLP